MMSVKWATFAGYPTPFGRREGLLGPVRPAKRGEASARGLLRQGKEKSRDQGPEAGHDEERPACDPGNLPGLRDEDLQDREARLAKSSMSAAAVAAPSFFPAHAPSSGARAAKRGSSSTLCTAQRRVAGDRKRPGTFSPAPAHWARIPFSAMSPDAAAVTTGAPAARARTSVPCPP